MRGSSATMRTGGGAATWMRALRRVRGRGARPWEWECEPEGPGCWGEWWLGWGWGSGVAPRGEEDDWGGLLHAALGDGRAGEPADAAAALGVGVGPWRGVVPDAVGDPAAGVGVHGGEGDAPHGSGVYLWRWAASRTRCTPVPLPWPPHALPLPRPLPLPLLFPTPVPDCTLSCVATGCERVCGERAKYGPSPLCPPGIPIASRCCGRVATLPSSFQPPPPPSPPPPLPLPLSRPPFSQVIVESGRGAVPGLATTSSTCGSARPQAWSQLASMLSP